MNHIKQIQTESFNILFFFLLKNIFKYYKFWNNLKIRVILLKIDPYWYIFFWKKKAWLLHWWLLPSMYRTNTTFLKLLQKNWGGRNTSSFYKDRILKPHKDTARLENYRPISLYEHVCENPQLNTTKQNSATY